MRQKLPPAVKACFHDYDVGKLSWSADRELIIRRVLAQGNWPSVQWLWQLLGDHELRKWLIQHHGKGLTPKQMRFWQTMLDLPKRHVSEWIDRDRQFPWNNRTTR